MFKLTKFSGEEFWVNPDHIKYIEDGGDRVVALTTGEKFLVQENIQDIKNNFIQYKQKIHSRCIDSIEKNTEQEDIVF